MADEKETASPNLAESGNAADDAMDNAMNTADLEITEDPLAEPETKRGGGRGSLLALIVLGVIIAGGFFSWPLLQPLLLAQLQGEAPETMAAIQQLDHRIAQLEAASARYDDAIATIKSAVADVSQELDDLTGAAPGADIIASLGQKLGSLEDTLAQLARNAGEGGRAALGVLAEELNGLKARMSELTTTPAAPDNADATRIETETAALAAENEQLRQIVAELQTRLEQLEATVRQAGRGEGLVLAVGQLSQTVLAGRPYAGPLAAVAALAAETKRFSDAITALTPTAKQGVATHRALSDQFPSVARAVLRADRKTGDSFLQRTWQRISSLVTVRRVGEVEGAEADAILARAERRLGAGELAAAIKSMDALNGPAVGAAQAWMARAKTRLGAEAALAEMQSRAIAALGDG